MYLKSIELIGFKSFGKKTLLEFGSSIASIVGPNGSGKSNVAEGFRFVLGEQSMKSMRSKRGEDLIWGGSPVLPRGNRAAVKLVFDNSTRLLDLDFTEVAIERVVHRDGENEYLLNGTIVRLKDIIRLLAGAHIGGSGYQIISQGEADRILNASPQERRLMVEDALGLKLYQHKKAESERKLEETAINIDKTKSLRREVAPHLKFLGIQVEKIEKAQDMRFELSHKLTEYLSREHAWLTAEETRLSEDVENKRMLVRTLEGKLKLARGHTGSSSDDGGKSMRELESGLARARNERERLARELGRAEGAAEVHAKEPVIAVAHVREFADALQKELTDALDVSDAFLLKESVARLHMRVRSFIEHVFGTPRASSHTEEAKRLAQVFAHAQQEEITLIAEVDGARSKAHSLREAEFSRAQEVIRIESEMRSVRSAEQLLSHSKSELSLLRQRFEEEVREAVALVGSAIRGFEKVEVPQGALSEDRREQEKRRREIERLKIKIEESGIGNSEAITKEYTQTRSRDEFLGKEVADLEVSAAKLKDIIADLERTVDLKFTEGLSSINEALTIFFTKLFGGGSAKMYVEAPKRARRGEVSDDAEEDGDVREEDELYAGLSITVHLPRKKVRGLEVLSGGERALTSIALIFAMSQVHPPPFLVLDETDAALDEANSRRFADMIRELSRKSQLIVITHNRATMAVAGELYGVTMGSDGVSTLLSVKLEEAERVAK